MSVLHSTQLITSKMFIFFTVSHYSQNQAFLTQLPQFANFSKASILLGITACMWSCYTEIHLCCSSQLKRKTQVESFQFISAQSNAFCLFWLFCGGVAQVWPALSYMLQCSLKRTHWAWENYSREKFQFECFILGIAISYWAPCFSNPSHVEVSLSHLCCFAAFRSWAVSAVRQFVRPCVLTPYAGLY